MSADVDETTPEVRTYWHSDHYTSWSKVGLIGPIWDVLHDHPEGITVPGIRDLLLGDIRVSSLQSWFLSFGAEQRWRNDAAKPGPLAGQLEQRYRRMDPDSEDSLNPSWDADRRFRYALTERVHWQVRTMRQHGQAVAVGHSGVKVPQTDFLHLCVGDRSPRTGGFLPLYVAGEVPWVDDPHPPVCPCGKRHHKTLRRRWVYREGLGPDPWILRSNWKGEVREALGRPTIRNARELLERGLELMEAVDAKAVA